MLAILAAPWNSALAVAVGDTAGRHSRLFTLSESRTRFLPLPLGRGSFHGLNPVRIRQARNLDRIYLSVSLSLVPDQASARALALARALPILRNGCFPDLAI